MILACKLSVSDYGSAGAYTFFLIFALQFQLISVKWNLNEFLYKKKNKTVSINHSLNYLVFWMKFKDHAMSWSCTRITPVRSSNENKICFSINAAERRGRRQSNEESEWTKNYFTVISSSRFSRLRESTCAPRKNGQLWRYPTAHSVHY